MNRQPGPKRAQRLQEIAREVGAVLENFDLSPLRPPQQPPSFVAYDDDRKADAILGRLRIEENTGKPPPRRLSAAFGKGPKPPEYSYVELYRALVWVIGDHGLPGVLEILLKKFKALDGNINLARRASTGVVKRVRGREEQEERGRLLSLAAGSGRLDFVQLLAPLADQQSLDEALGIVLEMRALEITEVLLRYGPLAPLD